jgi:hypothetical protein
VDDPLLAGILRDLITHDHQHWSALLAEMVQRELGTFHPGPDRGVKQAPFAVLTNALMPSVLVELGFITNREEERLMTRPEFHRDRPEALARAIRAFFDRYPPGGTGMRGAPPREAGQTLFGAFRNPVLLAAGTCGFGRGGGRGGGARPRWGPRDQVGDPGAPEGEPGPPGRGVPAGMVNSIGLANPGVEAVRGRSSPGSATPLRDPGLRERGRTHPGGVPGGGGSVLDDADGFLGYELNLSCPNDTRLGGLPFALDPEALAQVVDRGRAGSPSAPSS